MKLKVISIIIFALLATFVNVSAQSPNFLQTRCIAPNQSDFSRFVLARNGNIYLDTCPSGTFYINGVPYSSGGGGGVNGSGTTGFLPIWSGATTLANSPLSFTSNTYLFQNTAQDSEFKAELTPDTTAGRFRIGDYATTPTTFLDFFPDGAFADAFKFRLANQQVISFADDDNSTYFSYIRGGGEVQWVGSNLYNWAYGANSIIHLYTRNGFNTGNPTGISIDNANRLITFEGTGGVLNPQATVNLVDVKNHIWSGLVSPTIGNTTLNSQTGRVNVAAGSNTVTITNNIVDSQSIVVATAHANDATCSVKSAAAAGVKGSGSFTITMTANCTANTAVNYWIADISAP